MESSATVAIDGVVLQAGQETQRALRKIIDCDQNPRLTICRGNSRDRNGGLPVTVQWVRGDCCDE